MRIKQIIRQHRRDFQAEYECQHCGATQIGNGYDDANFHNNVIQSMPCKTCGKSGGDYEARTPKYAEWEVV